MVIHLPRLDRKYSTLMGVEILDLRGNQLTSIHSEAFFGLTKLKSLKPSENMLTSIKEDIFSPLIALKYLDLGSNLLTSIAYDLWTTQCKLLTITSPEMVPNKKVMWNIQNMAKDALNGLFNPNYKNLTSHLIQHELDHIEYMSMSQISIHRDAFVGLRKLITLDLNGNMSVINFHSS